MLKGIDVSRHQAVIDWPRVRSGGIDVAIIRTSYGEKATDDKAIYNIENALKNGVQIGVYHFVYADSKESVERNAEKFYSVCKPYLDKIKFGCWCDWEYDTDKRNGNKFNKEQRTELVRIFCEKCKQLGMPDVGVYANPDYLTTKFNDLSEYPLWIAKYGKKPSTTQWKYVMWQYSSKGNVSGIKGNVDLDEVYDGEPVLTSRAIVTPADVSPAAPTSENYFNVTSTAIITVPKGCCENISVENTSESADPLTPAPAINVQNANLVVTRIA